MRSSCAELARRRGILRASQRPRNILHARSAYLPAADPAGLYCLYCCRGQSRPGHHGHYRHVDDPWPQGRHDHLARHLRRLADMGDCRCRRPRHSAADLRDGAGTPEDLRRSLSALSRLQGVSRRPLKRRTDDCRRGAEDAQLQIADLARLRYPRHQPEGDLRLARHHRARHAAGRARLGRDADHRRLLQYRLRGIHGLCGPILHAACAEDLPRCASLDRRRDGWLLLLRRHQVADEQYLGQFEERWAAVFRPELRKNGNPASGGSLRRGVLLAKPLFDIVGHQRLEVRGDVRAAQRHGLLAIDEDGGCRRLARTGQGNADIGMLAFAGSVDDAAHDGDVQRLDTRIFLAPDRHVLADIVLDVLRQFLEHGRCRAAAAGTRRDDGHELTEAHHLQQLLRHLHFAGAVTIRLRRQRNADRIADAVLQHIAHGCRRSDNALGTHTGLGQAQMQRMVGALGQHGIDGDQILHLADLGRQDDTVARQADFLGKIGRDQRRLHDRLARHLPGRQRRAFGGVLVHQRGQEILIERTPVDADAHRLVVADRHLDNFGELLVLLVLEADIAGIDAVFRQRFGAGRMIGQQLVADIVEVADQRHVHAETEQPLANLRHGGGAFIAIDGDAHEFRTGFVKGRHLRHGRIDIGRIGIGHGLHDHGGTAADDHAADIDGYGGTARFRIEIGGGRHGKLSQASEMGAFQVDHETVVVNRCDNLF
ncbi:hypothetical protein RHSP_77665 [Rhizobium freirei PRF 81]|uniref:Uncharacterized protein n=1 Tax=Rhizobium freirei PRF 81 TaxID=363754 RepID=N6UR39_9HYPH|nr:hypothetical protein RHSP_77665 [Rhizobium freirei PRF 81]